MKEKQIPAKLLYIFSMLLLIAAVCVFVALRLRQPRAAELPLAELGSALEAGGYTAGLSLAGEAQIKRSFGLYAASYEEILYYIPEDFMLADEILIVKMTDASQQKELEEGVRGRIAAQMQIFDNYGTDQYSLLEDAQLYANERYFVYITGHQAREILSLVRSKIER